MNIEDLQNEFKTMQQTISPEQQSFFSLKSLSNFLLYYDKLVKYKNQVEPLLIEYFRIMKQENYFITKDKSTQLAGSYIYNIGRFYNVELGFKTRTDLSYALFWGIAVDFLLLLGGLFPKLYYVPVTTICLLISWWYKRVFYEKKNMVYGLRY